MANQQGQAFEDLRNTIQECSRIVRNRWKLAVIGLAAVSSPAFWYSQYLPREYASSSVFERRDDVVLQNLVQSNSPYGFSHLRTTLTMDMIGSRALAEAAVRAGLSPPEEFPGEGALGPDERAVLNDVVERYQLRPAVSLAQSTPSLDTIVVRCHANDPTVAKRFVAAIRDNYIDKTRRRMREILDSAREFFQAEAERVRGDIAAADEQIQAAFADFPGIDPSTDVASLGGRLETLRTEAAATRQRKVELEAQIDAREKFLLEAPTFYQEGDDAGPAVAGAASQEAPHDLSDRALSQNIESVKAQIIELMTGRGMTREHPQVQRLVLRLESLEELRTTLAQAPAPPEVVTVTVPEGATRETESYRQWKAQQARVELELAALRQQHQAAVAHWDETRARAEQFENIYSRFVENGEELRRTREQRAASLGEIGLWKSHVMTLDRILTIESGERGTQFSLIEEPTDGERPINPKLSSVFVVCSGLGLAAAALLMALAELFDRSFRSVGQVTRALGIPVLECVSVIPTPVERRRALRARAVWAPTLAVLLVVLALTAGLAYTSLARPGLHRSAMQRVDHALNAIGVASVLLPDSRTS